MGRFSENLKLVRDLNVPVSIVAENQDKENFQDIIKEYVQKKMNEEIKKLEEMEEQRKENIKQFEDKF